ncbi:MAG: ROK family transcriptional regulator [Anaerolineae bacterium]|nr:ROK family transcriptional regulator [Anaerolineae bacterium]
MSSLRKHPSQTRAKLSKQTGLTRSTISNLTDELITKNFVHEVGYEPSSGGRRGILLELNPQGGSAIAVKINASSVQCALSNFVGEISWHKLIPLTSTKTDYVLDIAKNLIQEAIQQNHNNVPILGIGVGATGLISDEGIVIYSKFMDWENVNFRPDWENKFNLPVSVDNEVSLAAFGENHYGAGMKDSHFIFVEIGYGLGAGVVIDGQLYQGKNGYAGEIGYLMSVQPDSNGTIQPVSLQSMTNIPRLVQTVERYIQEGVQTQLHQDNLTFETIIKAAHDNDPVASKAMIELSRYVGIGLANLVNTFDIMTFIIGGELGKQYEPYLETIIDEMQKHIVWMAHDNVQVRFSTLKPDAALMGAVAQVFDDILKEPSLNVIL